MAGYVEGSSKLREEVNLLSTAPGKRTLVIVSIDYRNHTRTYPAEPGFWDNDEDHRCFEGMSARRARIMRGSEIFIVRQEMAD